MPDVDSRAHALVAIVRGLLPQAQLVNARRVHEGVSTEVYQIAADDVVLYGRVLPEEGASFAPEAFAQRSLRAQGLHIPDVFYVQQRHPTLDRSVMITSEIAGRAIGHSADPAALRAVLRAAGRELARLNQMPVQGWGWVVRDTPDSTQLLGEQGVGTSTTAEPRIRDRILANTHINKCTS